VSVRAHGLRPRLLGVLVATSAVTLGVTALALLSPLEQRLREDGESSVLASATAFRPEYSEIRTDPQTGRPDPDEVAATTSLLRRRSGAQVTIFSSQLDVVYSPLPTDLDVPDYYTQVRRALSTDKAVHVLDGNELVVAEPIHIGGRPYVLVLLKRLQYVASAFSVVQSAFILAAAASFGIALLLGIGLTTTLLRRLERLLDATRELERHGLEAPLPDDHGRDEIGELARAFASMQTRLRREEAARRSFVATASHELRTPLASLDGMLELLQEDLESEHLDLADARSRTTQAKQQSRRLSRLASDLLDLSQLDAEVELRREPLELGELCRAVAAEFELRAAERHVEIQAKPPQRHCWVSGDPGAVARIVRILLDNALRVAPANSSIDVKTSSDGRYSRVTVSDRGPGVPEVERNSIFERFRRGSSTAGTGGFGLGLAIGRELATRMGGGLELAASSHTDDPSGANFTLRLPVAHVDQETTLWT
jgi:signal transduction histidine kinase